MIFVGLLGLIPLYSVFRWYNGGPAPEQRAFLALLCLLALPLGILAVLNAIRGLPRLTIKPLGVELQAALSTKWANWDSLDPFIVKTVQAGRSKRQIKTASSTITGPNASHPRAKLIRIPDHFDKPIEEIAAELNAARASSLGISADAIPVEIPAPAQVGLQQFTLPWLTFALLGILVAVFVVENRFAVMPGVKLTPSIQTLFAMGALSHTAILSGGEWYRLFTAPLLHASLAHILGNAIALLLGGWMLERLVGRLWYFAFFAIGALGGSLVSLAVGPENLVSVGASGALMGLFGGLFVSSFRHAPGSSSRTALQVNSLRILIPSLLPSFSSITGIHIDYGAHTGGALAGAALAFALLKSWPENALIPQRRRLAGVVAGISVLLFAASGGLAIANYPKYNVAIIPKSELPSTAAEYRERGATLVARYPNDPRSHLYLGNALAEAKDYVGAERELRMAVTTAEAHSDIFGRPQALISRGVLAIFLSGQGRQEEAKSVAHETCSPSEDAVMQKFVAVLKTQHLCD